MIRKSISKTRLPVLNSESSIKLNTISNYLPANNIVINLSTTSISSANLSTNGPNLSATATGNVSTTTANNLSTPNDSDFATKLTGQWSPKAENHTAKLEIVDDSTRNPQNPNSQNYLSLLVTPKNASPSNQEPTQKQQTHTSNIPPATVINDESLDAIFPFELEKLSNTPLFSGATLEEKPITAMYTDAKIDEHHIKLILDSGLNGQHTCVPAMCGHFKATNTTTPLIDFEEKKPKPTWEAYQVSWADEEHNELPPILSWDNNEKRKQTTELTWETNNLTWTDNEQEETSSWE
ncbi:hypothetical protein G9A89_013228 [Geosiphon pyriformis]|nr:hypothetical protein G9A89_013228 [Geosiphon pyriformis]